MSFSPSINGTISGAVAIADGTSLSPQVYDLTGHGVLPLSSSATSLTFAAQTVGTTSASETVTLTNNQSTALSITIAASGQYAATAGGTSPCAASLGAGAKCTFNVTFTPSSTGTVQGVVTVNYGESSSPLEVKLTGTGE